MGYPTGGEKDTLPPKIISETPPNASVNFNQQEIILRFNEYIKISNTQQIISSPAILPNPEYQIRGKSLRIIFKDTLKANTTYSINFGSAISDITENNINSNIIYAFSTGNTIDTLKISGRVISAITRQPEKGVKVMLYTTDSLELKSMPSYLSVTDNNGFFKINYLKKGNYYIAALKDINANYLYDLPNEEIAIFDNKIFLQNDSLTDITLYLFKEDKDKQYISKANFIEPGKIIIKGNRKFQRPVATVNTGLPSSITDYEFFQYSQDTIVLWFNKPTKDTLQLIVNDSNFMEYKTIYLDKTSKSNRNKVSITHNATGYLRTENSLILQTDYPCINTQAQLEKIILLEDSTRVNYTIENINALKWKINFTKTDNKTYKVIIPAKIFIDIYGNTNDSTLVEVKTPKAEYYGLLNMSVQSITDYPYILQLINTKGAIIKSIPFNKELKTTIDKLEPGNYTLRIIFDLDRNNEWTNGDFENKKLPEKIIYYDSQLNIRSNWDLDIIWNLKE